MVKVARKRQHPCGPPNRVRDKLRTWYAVGLGQRLLKAECVELDEVLCNLFGYHLVQVGAYADENLLRASRISHSVIVDVEAETLSRELRVRSLCGNVESLPVAGASVDVVVLHHTLEFSTDPYRVLREADRALVAEGHVVIVGFNPWSFWLPWRWLLRWRNTAPWCGRALGRARLKDWLSLLGFDMVYTRNYFFLPPFRHAGVLDRLGFLDHLGRRFWPFFGAGFVLVGRKRVTALTPIRPRWKPRRALLGSGVAEPQNRERSS